MLREDAGGGRTAPLPDAGDLPGLIEQFRSAGGDVSLAVDGDTARLPATTGLAMYRILQEALTNAVKHAPGAHTSVHLAADGREARLTADTAAAPGTGTGFGLLNMRERAESVGGTLAAGPGGRGWLVQATFPVGKSRSGGDAR
jgi:signal transduction histidine kinase